jgi:hypothetical protein
MGSKKYVTSLPVMSVGDPPRVEPDKKKNPTRPDGLFLNRVISAHVASSAFTSSRFQVGVEEI